GESSGSIAQRRLHRDHLPRIREIVRGDITKHREAIVVAAERLAPGFRVEDPATRERQMRAALRVVQEPPRGISAFLSSPMTFLAAIDPEGIVIARDTDPDPMKGKDFGSEYPVIASALENAAVGYSLVEFEGMTEEDQSSFSLVFAAPARIEGETVGAVALGIPLWSLSKRINQQLRVELHSEFQQGAVVWVYFYRGDRLFHRGTPPDLDKAVPGAEQRAEGLARSPGGYTGKLAVLGREYGYAVLPMPSLGEDVGVVAIRGEP
ncbi:MAG: hypothetical protein H5U40_11705, partial [Polyangiaceae bacterium]|nr:hypothetical protein [Polyangiaceae bacterium]